MCLLMLRTYTLYFSMEWDSLRGNGIRNSVYYYYTRIRFINRSISGIVIIFFRLFCVYLISFIIFLLFYNVRINFVTKPFVRAHRINISFLVGILFLISASIYNVSCNARHLQTIAFVCGNIINHE